MIGHHNKSNNWGCSPLKTMLRKIWDRYQTYCTTYKSYAMTTGHRGAGHTGEDRDLDSHIEDTRGIDIGPSNDNENTVWIPWLLFGGSEADGYLSDLLPNGQANLSMLTREINSLQQQVETAEDELVEGWTHRPPRTETMESLTLRAQLTSTPAPTEPFGEVVCQYMDTLCVTQKPTNQQIPCYRTLPSSMNKIQ